MGDPRAFRRVDEMPARWLTDRDKDLKDRIALAYNEIHAAVLRGELLLGAANDIMDALKSVDDQMP